MVDDTVSREPTAHVEADLDVQQAAAGSVARGSTAHVDAELLFHGAGEP